MSDSDSEADSPPTFNKRVIESSSDSDSDDDINFPVEYPDKGEEKKNEEEPISNLPEPIVTASIDSEIKSTDENLKPDDKKDEDDINNDQTTDKHDDKPTTPDDDTKPNILPLINIKSIQQIVNKVKNDIPDKPKTTLFDDDASSFFSFSTAEDVPISKTKTFNEPPSSPTKTASSNESEIETPIQSPKPDNKTTTVKPTNNIIFAESSDEESTTFQQIAEAPIDDEIMELDEDDPNFGDNTWVEFQEKNKIEKSKPIDVDREIGKRVKNALDSDEDDEPIAKKLKTCELKYGDLINPFDEALEDMQEFLNEEMELPMSPAYLEDDLFMQQHLAYEATQITASMNYDDEGPSEPKDEEDVFTKPIEPKAIVEEEIEDNSISDFDKMMQKKKTKAKSKRQRKNDISHSTETDEMINDLMKKMAQASDHDKKSCVKNYPAIKKLKLLPKVLAAFKVKGHQEQLVENGVMTAISDWLSPLPNGALPALQIRSGLLNCLLDFPICPTSTLKASGVGKAIARLISHPKEDKNNKKVCKRLMKRWCKQIFNIDDTGGFSREERQERDLSQYQRYGHSKQSVYKQKIDREMEILNKLKVHEKGFVNRARVPTSSTKDYLIRPKSNIDEEFGDVDISNSKTKNIKKVKVGNTLLMDKTKRRIANIERRSKSTKSSTVKVMGSHGIL